MSGLLAAFVFHEPRRVQGKVCPNSDSTEAFNFVFKSFQNANNVSCTALFTIRV